MPLRELRYEQVELWPRDMAPGYYDAVTTACRAAGFEPRLDADGAGSTVWSHLTEGRGVGLVVSSMAAHLPAGITVARIEPPGESREASTAYGLRTPPVFAAAHPASASGVQPPVKADMRAGTSLDC